MHRRHANSVEDINAQNSFRKPMNSIRQPYWERIDSQKLAKSIDALPGEHDLFLFGRLVASGLMRELSTLELEVRYARLHEGTLRYLVATQHGEDFLSLALHYTPFIYALVKQLPTLSTIAFAQVFRQYVYFASQQDPVTTAENIACQIANFIATLASS